MRLHRGWPILRRVFGFDYADDQPITKDTRRGLTYFYWDAVFSLLGDSSSANYVNLFLVALKASNTQIVFLRHVYSDSDRAGALARRAGR